MIVGGFTELYWAVMKINDCGWFQRVILGGIFMLGIAGIVASGGGDGEEEEEIFISAYYYFQLGGPLEEGDSFIDIDGDGYDLSTKPDLQGKVICDQINEICGLQAVEAGSSIDITGQITTDPDPFDVGINIMVETIFRWDYDSGADLPFAGSLLVTPTAAGSSISVEVKDCDTGNVEVTVDPDGTTPTVECYTWEVFEGLLDDAGSSPEELQASLAWGAVAFIVEQGLNSLEVFPLIVDDVFAVRGNLITESCETWDDWPVNPPTLKPGYFTFFWDDVAGPGQVGSGDSFSQMFDDCWFGDLTDGTLLDGSIDYVGYIQEIDFNYLLTRIGFVSVEIGGVDFDSLVITETTQLGNDITADSPITLTGRYLIVFFR